MAALDLYKLTANGLISDEFEEINNNFDKVNAWMSYTDAGAVDLDEYTTVARILIDADSENAPTDAEKCYVDVDTNTGESSLRQIATGQDTGKIWTRYGTITDETVTWGEWADVTSKLGNSTVGSSSQPIYLSSGTPTVCTSLAGALVGTEVAETIAGISAMNRNGLYRGASLGTIASETEFETFLSNYGVTAGTFDNLYLGDYFTISDGTYNKAWQIAGFDYFYNMGDTTSSYPARTTHHLALIPRTSLVSSVMNESATTGGGYYNCYLRLNVLPEVLTALQGALGESHLLCWRERLSSSVSTTAASAWAPTWTGCANGYTWVDTYIELMSIAMIFNLNYNISDMTYCSGRLPLFRFINWSQAGSRNTTWLRDVASSAYFAHASGYGTANYHTATDSNGVFPLVLVG